MGMLQICLFISNKYITKQKDNKDAICGLASNKILPVAHKIIGTMFINIFPLLLFLAKTLNDKNIDIPIAMNDTIFINLKPSILNKENNNIS